MVRRAVPLEAVSVEACGVPDRALPTATEPAASRRRAIRTGALLMLASLLLVLVTNALARDLAGRYPIGEILFFRFLGALPIVLWHTAGAGVAAMATERVGLHAARAALGVAGMAALYASSRHLPFSDLIALSYSAPVFVALLAYPLLGERISALRFLVILGGFGGVLLIACPGQLRPWSLGALAMALLNALSILGARSLAKTDSAAGIAFYFALFGMLLTAPLLALDWRNPAASDALELAALGLSAGSAIFLNAHAYRCAPASVLAPIDYLAILFSAGMGLALWSEVPGPAFLIGGALLVAAGFLNLRLATASGSHVTARAPGHA
jgi:drug/metabolite transporter (DMT)-like permease